MRLQRQRRARVLASDGGVVNLPVLGMHVAPAVQADRIAPVALRMLGQLAHQPQRPRRAAGRQQRLVERSIGRLPALHVLVLQRLLERGQPLPRTRQLLPPAGVAIPYRQPQRLGLDRHAHIGHVGQVLDADRRDREAALPLGGDDGLGDQPRQRLAHGAGADVIAQLQVLDQQLFSRHQPAVQDVFAQQPVGALDQRAIARALLARIDQADH